MNTPTILLAVFLLLPTTFRAEVQFLPIRVHIDGYRVEHIADLDLVTIDDGQTFGGADGRPSVPYRVLHLVYPSDYRIQDVVLKSKTGLKTDSGLRLPVAQPTQGQVSAPIAGLFPTTDYSWSVVYKESTRVVLMVYPFRYDPVTRKSVFHSDFEFEVRYVRSLVRITEVLTDTAAYEPDKAVRLRVRLANRGAAQKVQVVGSVSRLQSGVVVKELAAVTIERLNRADSVVLEWPAAGQEPDDYVATVRVQDASGIELDRGRVSFRLGNPQAEVTDFTAEPLPFKLGSRVRFRLTVTNSGNCDLTGEGVVRITRAGEVVDELKQRFSRLRPGSTTVLCDSWNTVAADKGAVYTALGFAAYAGTASNVMSLLLSTNAMPVSVVTLARDSVKVNEEIMFDGSASYDRDGTVTAYDWNFGDGGTAQGSVVRHTYRLPGHYEVRLIVTDAESGQGEQVRRVTVIE